MPSPKMRCPQNPAKTLRATKENKHAHVTASWVIREAVSAITLGALFGVIFWSCVLGMSGNFGPGKGLVLPPIAEADHE